MKSIKIVFENSNYPLFIDTGLLNRLNEFCDLYRFSTNRIILSASSNSGQIPQLLPGLENFEHVTIPFELLHAEFNSIFKILNYLPWGKFKNGITLIVVGEDWLICSATVFKQLSAIPVHLVCVPTSFWSMLETGVNDSFSLNWKKNYSVLKTDYSPNLVLLDVDFLSDSSDDPLLGITVVLRHLLQVNPDIFHLFKSNIPEVLSSQASENIQVVEELVASRLSLFKNETDKKCLKDFGIRFWDFFHSQSKSIIASRELAMMVLIDICWRWKISKALKICQADDTDSVFSLIEKICIKNHVSSDEWNQAKNRLIKIISQDLFKNIHLPESIGKFKCVESIDFNLAEQSLQNC